MTTLTSPALVAKICDRAAQTVDVKSSAVEYYVEYVTKEMASMGVDVDRADLTEAVQTLWCIASD